MSSDSIPQPIYQQGQANVDLESLAQSVGGDTSKFQDCQFGVQVEKDGRVWICINGVTWLRFKPAKARERCSAVIFHGPGHQSKSQCELVVAEGYEHEHEAWIMGSMIYWEWPVASLDYDEVAHERVYCDQGDGCHCLREPGDTSLCGGYMHPRNRTRS
jgi:hypothetical protein